MKTQFSPLRIHIESANSSARLSHPLARLVGFTLLVACFLVHFGALGITPPPAEARSMALQAEQPDSFSTIADSLSTVTSSPLNFDAFKPAPLGTIHEIPAPFQTGYPLSVEIAPTFLNPSVEENLIALHYGL